MAACADWKDKYFSFFSHSDCEYFPCHSTGAMDPGDFNCLFCFCPLYRRDDCGGSFSYLKNGCKDCSACTFPHEKGNYGRIMERLSRPAAPEDEKAV